MKFNWRVALIFLGVALATFSFTMALMFLVYGNFVGAVLLALVTALNLFSIGGLIE